MKWPVLPLALAAIAGCSTTEFASAMNLGGDGRLRPLGIIVEPPEAAPGDTVTVTLVWRDPDASATSVGWRVALEYVTGRQDEVVERHYMDLAAAPPVGDGDGFYRQSLSFEIPPETLSWSPALDYLVGQPTLADAAAQLGLAGKPQIDRFLATQTPTLLDASEVTHQAQVRRLADLFGCMIRFRATITTGDGTIDVTRSLTVRHSSRLGSTNVNVNHVIDGVRLATVRSPDAVWSDDEAFVRTVEFTDVIATPGEVPRVTVPIRDDATYYLVLDAVPQQYGSPYAPDQRFTEYLEWRTYWYTPDDPTNSFAPLRDDAGDPTDLESIDNTIRLAQPGAADPKRFRAISVVRDEWTEWEQFQVAPGLTITEVEVAFE